MSERLTDEEFSRQLAAMMTATPDQLFLVKTILSMLPIDDAAHIMIELATRARRTADLTSDDVADLHELRLEAQRRLLGGDAYDLSEHERRCKVARAIALLSRLIQQGAGK